MAEAMRYLRLACIATWVVTGMSAQYRDHSPIWTFVLWTSGASIVFGAFYFDWKLVPRARTEERPPRDERSPRRRG